MSSHIRSIVSGSALVALVAAMQVSLPWPLKVMFAYVLGRPAVLKGDSLLVRFGLTSLDRLMAGRTVFVIAHRLATLRRAERMYVIDPGRIVESGRRPDLIHAGELHSRIDHLQHATPNEAHSSLRVLPTGTEVSA